MDTTDLAAELGSDDPDLPPAETAFIDAVETAREKLASGEISREEYDERVRTASDRYRSATSSGVEPGVGVDSPDEP